MTVVWHDNYYLTPWEKEVGLGGSVNVMIGDGMDNEVTNVLGKENTLTDCKVCRITTGTTQCGYWCAKHDIYWNDTEMRLRCSTGMAEGVAEMTSSWLSEAVDRHRCPFIRLRWWLRKLFGSRTRHMLPERF